MTLLNSPAASVMLLLGALAVAPGALAQNAPAEVPTGPPVFKQTIEEVLHNYVVTPYQPELGVDSASIPAGSVEKTVAVWIKAMQAGQYDAALGYWDAPSKAQIADRNRALGKSPADWAGEWGRLYSGNKAVLTHKIKYGKFWLIAYSVKNPAGQLVLRETVALDNAGGKWQLTLALAENVVLSNWESDKQRIQRLAAPLYKTVK
jgi:hypothetical protein